MELYTCNSNKKDIYEYYELEASLSTYGVPVENTQASKISKCSKK